MEKTGPLKSALKSSSSDATNLASKIQNIGDPLGESDQPKSPKDGFSNDQPAKTPLRCDIDVEIVVVTAYNHDLWF
ncbi:hypothetical protein Tco_0984144 [Tanacetum coccineum]